MYLDDDHNSVEKGTINRLECLVHCFVDLIVSPEVNSEIIIRLDEVSTLIVECISEFGDDEKNENIYEKLMEYVIERINEYGAEEYAICKIELLLSIYGDDSD